MELKISVASVLYWVTEKVFEGVLNVVIQFNYAEYGCGFKLLS